MNRLPGKFLCTRCQIAMRRYISWPLDGTRPVSTCGQCGGAMSYVHHKFRAPPKRDRKMWAVIRHLEGAGLIKVLDRGRIPQTMREAEAEIAAIREQEIEARSPTKLVEKRQKRHRAAHTERKRRQSVKARRWAQLSKYGKA